MALLELKGVDAAYGRIQALRKMSIDVNKGEVVALIGSNGAGKTTTLRTISGLMHPQAGTIGFDGRDITTTGPARIVALGICQSPEGRRLFPRMTVQDNLFMGAYSRNDRPGIASDMERVFTLFSRLRERRTQIAGTLSGGEQQMSLRSVSRRSWSRRSSRSSARSTRRARPCSWWSRTRTRRWRSRTAATSWRQAPSSRPARARSSWRQRTFRKLIWVCSSVPPHRSGEVRWGC